MGMPKPLNSGEQSEHARYHKSRCGLGVSIPKLTGIK
jgi:hypothetical protein